MNNEYIFSNRAKLTTYVMMAIGIIALIVGFIMDSPSEGVSAEDYHHNRWWANLLTNGFFFFAIALGALFFYGLQYATETAWSVLVKRIFEAIFAYLPWGIFILTVIFICSSLHINHIYHWMDSEVMNPESEHFDLIIYNKRAYLNQPFFWLRTIAYFVTFYVFARSFRKRSLMEDQVGGTELHFKNYKKAALFLVLFAVFSSTLSWDWLMSIDTHWFSTMYGWYVFSGMWVGAMITAVILVMYLQGKGHLKEINKNHIHDLGKWVFAISILWSYLWFSQFMLIWYSDIPEEVIYFQERFEHFKVPFMTMYFVNLIVPLVLLISRDAKRNKKFLISVGTIIFLGHWMDLYLIVSPGTVHHWNFGLMEIGMFIGFLGLFMYVVLNALTKASLIVKNHPYLDESLHFQQ